MNWCEKVSDPEPIRPEAGWLEADKPALRRLLKERAKGPFLTAAEFRAEIDAMLARKRRELGG